MQDYLSEHAVLRMSQRAIRRGDLELIERLGTEVEGGHLIRLKDFQAFEAAPRGAARRPAGAEHGLYAAAASCLEYL